MSQISTPTAERPVFVADDGRRARRLAFGTRAAATLVAAWVIALAAGSIGFARLPAMQPGVLGPAASTRHVGTLASHRVALRRRGRDIDARRDCAPTRGVARPGSLPCHSITV